MKKIKQFQQGAAALLAVMIIMSGILATILSVTIIAMDNHDSINSFASSMQSFYAAEYGVGEALLQIRKEPNNFTFDNLVLNDVMVGREFIQQSGTCEPIPECQFLPGSGWWGEYFNYSINHPDMDVDPYPGPTPTPTEHDWYDDTYKIYEQIDEHLEIDTSMWFPYDGTEWEDKEGQAHDYHFGMHWRAKVTAPSSGNYAYELASDDDSWVLVGGIVIVNNSGTHAAFTKTGDIYLDEGDSVVEVYFAERHDVESGFSFKFNDSNLVITPWPEGCGEDIDCDSNIQATASTTEATRKARYTCTQDIENCGWNELIP